MTNYRVIVKRDKHGNKTAVAKTANPVKPAPKPTIPPKPAVVKSHTVTESVTVRPAYQETEATVEKLGTKASRRKSKRLRSVED